MSLKSLTLMCNQNAFIAPNGNSQTSHHNTPSTAKVQPNVSCLLVLSEYASLLGSSPFSATTNAYIVTSQQLDFQVCPRPNVICPSMPTIQVHNAKQLPEGMKWFIICTYECFTNGLESNLSYKNRLKLIRSIVKMISYHNRYGEPPVNEKTVAKYLVKYRSATRTGVNVGNVFKSISTNTRLSYVAMLQDKYPEFLHGIFCYSSKNPWS